jgi:branched-chain amino acid transport system ATP-binding protein
MILKCENVTKQFGKLYAVDDLSFEVEEGIIFGIAGTNGSGKTTTFNLITGIYPFTGDIIFNGEKISAQGDCENFPDTAAFLKPAFA